MLDPEVQPGQWESVTLATGSLVSGLGVFDTAPGSGGSVSSSDRVNFDKVKVTYVSKEVVKLVPYIDKVLLAVLK